MERSVLVNEIEEAFSNGTSLASMGSDSQPVVEGMDLNEYINEYSLGRVSEHGVDPYLQGGEAGFVLSSSVASSSSGSSAISSSGSSGANSTAADPVLEEQLSILLDFLNSYDSSFVYLLDREEGGHTSREVLLSMKLNKYVFDPLMKSVKSNRQALHKTLLSQPLISGESKVGTMGKKKRREMITEAKSKQKRGKSRSNSLGSNPSDVEMDRDDKVNSYKNVLAAAVGKGVAEETLTSYLIVVCLLLNVMKEERERATGWRSKKSTLSKDSPALSGLPIANVIGALFEKRANASEETSESVPNPFRKFLLSALGGASTKKEGDAPPTTSVASRADSYAGDSGGEDMGDRADEMSLDGTSAERGTAATIRSDVGTVSVSAFSSGPGTPSLAPASVAGGSETLSHTGTMDGEDRDLEDEMLVQQSLGTLGGAETVGAGHGGVGSSSSSSSGGGAGPDSTTDSRAPSVAAERIGTPVPDTLPEVPALSTYGPFCSVYMHKLIEQDPERMSDERPAIPSLPTDQVVVALLTVVAASADTKMDIKSAPLVNEKRRSSSISSGVGSPASAKQGKDRGHLVGPLTTQLEVTPNAVNFLLIEYSLDILLLELLDLSASTSMKAGEDTTNGDFEEEFRRRLYFVVWSIGAVLKALCASLHAASEQNLNANSLGLGALADVKDADGVDFGSGGKKGSTPRKRGSAGGGGGMPFVFRLLRKIACCIGLPQFVAGDHNGAVDRALLFTDLQVAVDSTRDASADRHTTAQYRHYLRMLGVDAYVAGLALFCPDATKRDRLLRSLLERAPVASAVAPYGSVVSPYEVPADTDAWSSIVAEKGQTQSSKDGYYLAVVLQKLCVLLSRDSKIYSMTNTLVQPGCFGEYNVQVPKAEHSKALLFSTPPSKGSRDASTPVEASPFSAEKSGGGGGGSASKGAEQGSVGTGAPLEVLLLERLHDKDLMLGFNRENNHHGSSQHPCALNLFWGELTLLRAMQVKHTQVFFDGISDANIKHHNWTFDGRRCSQNISISNDSKTLSHRSQKVWSTVLGNEPIEANSGVYEWAIEVEASEKGHCFVGIATAEATMDSYVGCDRHGWGLIGTRALWHNKQKQLSNYGSGFQGHSIVHVRYDSDRHTLSFSTKSRDWGVAFSDLPRKTMYPAVSVFQQDDVVNVCGDVHTRVRPDLRLLQTPLVQYTQALSAHCIQMLQHASSPACVASDRALVMQHPFIGLLVPSLVVSFTSDGSRGRSAGAYPAVQLLPCLSVMAKMMSLLYGISTVATKRPDLDMMGHIAGEWVFRALSGGSHPVLSLPPSRYKVTLEYSDEDNDAWDDHEDSSEGKSSAAAAGQDPSELRISGSRKIRGEGGSVVASMSVQGAQLGSRAVFREVWNADGSSSGTVKGAFSLCGSFFKGTYTDSKSSKTTKIRGFRAEVHVRMASSQCTLLKSCCLTLMACSRLAGVLMEGVGASIYRSLSPSSSTAAAATTTTATTARDQPTPDEASPTAALEETSYESLVAEWLGSELFSGGLMDEEIHSSIVSRLAVLAAAPNERDTSAVNAQQREGLEEEQTLGLEEGLQGDFRKSARDFYEGASLLSLGACMADVKSYGDWWFSSAFPVMRYRDQERGSSRTSIPNMGKAGDDRMGKREMLGPEDDGAKDDDEGTVFVTAEGWRSESGERVDAFLCHHTGQTTLKKVGGDSLQAARRSVLAALVEACGCVGLCKAEDSALDSGAKSPSDRPSPPLLDVWRASKRVIEQAIKTKQESGLPYSSVCQHLYSKATLLLDLKPCDSSREIADDFHMLPDVTSVEVWQSEAAVEAHQSCARLVSDAVEFFLSPLTKLGSVRQQLVSRSVDTVARTAGYQSLLLLLQKQEGPVGNLDCLPAVSSPWLQAYVAADMSKNPLCSSSFFSSSSPTQGSGSSSPKSTPPTTRSFAAVVGRPISPIAATSSPSSGISSGSRSRSVPRESAHYSDGLQGVAPALMLDLETAFEGAHGLITNTLQRCAWNEDRSGQCQILRVWRDMRINPADHAFLNTVNIFQVLQTTLENSRAAVTQASSYQSVEYGGDGDGSILLDTGSQYLLEMAAKSAKRLSQLALQVVHSLAAQVAFSKGAGGGGSGGDGDGKSKSPVKPIKLQRSISGPDTLSQSLFDMLFNELYNEIRVALARIRDRNSAGAEVGEDARNNVAGHSSVGTGAKRGGDDKDTESSDGDSDRYLFQLLRLLFTVSSSKVCQRSLSSPKWLSLLMSFVGFGSFGVQRRVMRLLRRILVGLDPGSLEAHVSPLFSNEKAVVVGDACLDDDDARSLMHLSLTSPTDTHPGTTTIATAELIVRSFFEGVSAIVPVVRNQDDERAQSWLMKHLNDNRSARAFSVECLNVLRELQGIPKWRAVISTVLCGEWGGLRDYTKGDLDKEKHCLELLLRCSSAVALLGGVLDCFRPGGQVLIRPFNFVEPSSTFASTLAAASHTSGMVVAKNGSNVEVVEMERMTKLSLDTSTDEVIIQHSAFLTNSLPIRTVRINVDSLVPTSDVAVFPEVIKNEIFLLLIGLLRTRSAPWLHQTATRLIALQDQEGAGEGEEEDGGEPSPERPSVGDTESALLGDDGPASGESGNTDKTAVRQPTAPLSDADIVELLLHTFAFKSMSYMSQSVEAARQFVKEDPSLFLKLLQFSNLETAFGGLNVLEEIEHRWNTLWDAYCDSSVRPDEAPGASTGTASPGERRSGIRAITTSTGSGTTGANVDIVDRLEAVVLDGAGAGEGETVSISAGSILAALTQQAESRSSGGAGADRSGGGSGGGAEMPRSILLEAAAAAGILNPFMGLRAQPQVDEAAQASAIAQMVDIGLPPEWCEVALRRCRWNVEMAINLCFEHGDGMAQIVAEDQIMRQAQQSQQQGLQQQQQQSQSQSRGPSSRDRRRSSRESGRARRASNASRANQRRAQGGGAGAPAVDMNLVRQLQDMGFPEVWCVRALQMAGGDVDNALSFILSHADELGAASEGDSGVDASNPAADGVEPAVPRLNPLMCVSGDADISPDLTCAGTDGFPSIGCRGFGVSSGKWYYEAVLVTAGCVQIGWVDHAYVSDPGSGEGVGDCKHSWAYDGWRVFLWNEMAIEWGARWSVGDVVGCLLDLDNRVMSFTLNGLGTEIGMGEGYRDFSFAGGMFPCISFNRNESVRFNLGSTPLKHGPPPGYRSYVEHVEEELAAAKILRARISGLPLQTLMPARYDSVEMEYEEDGEEGGEPAFSKAGLGLDDSLEEASYETNDLRGNAKNTHTRYFHGGDTFVGEFKSLPRAPRSNLPSSIPSPRAREDLLQQLVEVSQDLCILYSRLTVLRTLNSVSVGPSVSPTTADDAERETGRLLYKLLLAATSEQEQGTDIPLLSSSQGGRVVRPIHRLLKLLKLCTITSSRTKIHNMTMSLLPPFSPFPKNLGSVFSSGGAPLMGFLSDALADLISISRADGEEGVVDEIMDALLLETSGSVDRAHGGRWEDRRGLAPIINDDSASDYSALEMPSLLLALWFTSTLSEQLAVELAAYSPELTEAEVAKKSARLVRWLESMVEHWSLVLRAASVDAKLCAAQVLLTLLQSVVSTTGSLTRLPRGTIVSLLKHIDYPRLCKHTLSRLDAERFSYPICSEYLQALAELTSVTHYCLPLVEQAKQEREQEQKQEQEQVPPIGRSRQLSIAIESPALPLDDFAEARGSLELYEDCGEAHFDSEALRGQVLGENGWMLFTGTLNQLSLPDAPDHSRRQSERHNLPPTLLPGNKVVRQVMVTKKVAVTRLVEGAERRDGDDSPSRTADDKEETVERDLDIGTAGTSEEGDAMLIDSPGGDSESGPSSPATKEAPDDDDDGGENEDEATRETETVVEERHETLEQVGEVVQVQAWPGEGEGTARLVRWQEVTSATSSEAGTKVGSSTTAASPPATGTIRAWIESSTKERPSGGRDSPTSGAVAVMGRKIGEEIVSAPALPGASQELMRWDTYAGDYGGMKHVEVDSQGGITRYYPDPPLDSDRAAAAGFGKDLSFGVILRVRELPLSPPSQAREGTPIHNHDDNATARLVGVLEIPDFSAEILVRGYYYDDGRITFTEEQLLSGPRHSSWMGRFGVAAWQPGATYELTFSRKYQDRSDGYVRTFMGTASHQTQLGSKAVSVLSDVSLQAEHLFTFDSNMKAPFVHLSQDKMSAYRNRGGGGGSAGCAFGNIGFSGGVHYWEVKVECAAVGSVFIGVSEKQGQYPGMHDASTLRRKVGMGVISNRTAYRAPSTRGVGEKAYVYGENFHTGDTVGVHLDMNKGVLSFFLDGLKYGEHSISDMGPAFDALRGPDKVKNCTYFPMVGLFSSSDRVTLTPRWLSSMTTRSVDELEYVDKAWGLLNSWSLERKTSNVPSRMHMWVYKDGWRNWIQWRDSLQSRIRTRCKSIPVDVSVTPRACAEASIRLGLRHALYRGDRFVFLRSQGRKLEIKEEAVVLGAFGGKLWYRLDTQQGDTQKNGELVESGSLAWTLAPSDVEDIEVIPRGSVRTSTSSDGNSESGRQVPDSVCRVELARISRYQGCLLYVSCEGEHSVMRDGMEIDNAEELCHIPSGTRLLALECRHNSSNILRFKVIHDGHVGWISERMRGGSESVMVEYVSNPSQEELDEAFKECAEMADIIGYDSPLSFPIATSLEDAMSQWEASVRIAIEETSMGGASSDGAVDRIVKQGHQDESNSFETYLDLATTLDGSRQWTVEADMQLSELISQCASNNGVVPANLSHQSFDSAVRAIDSSSHSPLLGIDPERAIARAALLRVANKVISYALPYLNLSLPEEKVAALAVGADDFIDVIPSDLSPLKDEEDLATVREGARANPTSPGSPARVTERGRAATTATNSSSSSSSGITNSDDSGNSPATPIPTTHHRGAPTPTSAGSVPGMAGVRGGRRMRRANSGGMHISSQSSADHTDYGDVGGAGAAGLRQHKLVPEGKGYAAPVPAPFAGEWSPSCSARRLRSLRRLLFSQTKVLHLEAILESTTTPTILHQDEYEDPREIKTLEINRVKATKGVLSNVSNPLERLKQTVFGQFHREGRGWSNAAFRRSYLGKGHGGQKRAFKVQFQGEGVNDYGGPYRALFEGIVDEIQSDRFSVGKKPSERALLPLLVPCNNRAAAVGANQDKFVFNTATAMPLVQELALFLGKTVGTAARHNLTLGIDLSALQWRSLVRLPLSLAHLETVDYLTCASLTKVTQLGLEEEYRAKRTAMADSSQGGGDSEAAQRDLDMSAGADVDLGEAFRSTIPEEWADLRFSTYLPDGGKKELLPGGDTLPVTLGNWREYVSLMELTRLKESAVMIKAFRNGLSAVLPAELLPLFTAREIEEVISGHSDVNIDLLKRCTEYDDIDPNGETAKNFWKVIDSFTNEERTLFLRFVWARSRLPTSLQGFDMNFRLQGPQGAAKEAHNDDYLPHAQTCFFSLSLPHYSSYEKMREKMLYAINNSPNMDADVRLHSAEGFDI